VPTPMPIPMPIPMRMPIPMPMPMPMPIPTPIPSEGLSATCELAARGLSVWRFRCPAIGDGERARLAAWLPPDEVARAQRFADSRAQDRFLLQRVGLRILLWRAAGAPARALSFGLGPRGKPFLSGAGTVQFSLAHAGDEALVAIADGFAVGVDLESAAARIDPDALAKIVLAPAEVGLVQAAQGAERRHAFLRVWCRKEAALKAVGLGLVDDLTAVSVAGEELVLGASRVWLRDLAVGDGLVAAIAATEAIVERGSAGEEIVELRWTTG
jgi:phosphopantetheinyl transferase